MESITIVMMRTSNTFEDCMKMRIGTLLSIIRNIRLNDLMQNQEWRDAYLKYQYKKAYEKNKIVKQTEIDLQKLIDLQKKL
jgi:hypothetical protein